MKCILLVLSLFIINTAYSQEPVMVMPIGHSGPVHTSLFSPDGNFILTAAWHDPTARLWHRQTGKLVHSFELHRKSVSAIAFNEDGSLLATGSDDSSFAVWETRTGNLRFHNRSAKDIRSVHFIPGLSELVVASGDSVLFYTDRTGKLKDGLFVKNFDSYSKVSLAEKEGYIFIPDYWNKKLWIGNISGGTKKWSSIDQEDQCRNIELLDDHTLLIPFYNGNIRHIKMNGDVISEYKVDYLIERMELSADKKNMLLISSETPYIEIRRISDYHLVAAEGENDDKYATRIEAAFNPVTNHLAIAYDGDKGVSYERVTDSLSREKAFLSPLQMVYGIRFSPDGRQFIVNSGNNPKLWQTDQATEPLASLEGHANKKIFVRPVYNDSLLVVGSDKTGVELWDLKKHEMLYTLNGKLDKLSKIIISPSGKHYITFDDNNNIQLWETIPGQQLSKINVGRIPGSDDRNPVWLKTDKEEKPPSIVDKFSIPAFRFDHVIWSKDESLVIGTTTETEAIPVWNIRSGELVMNILLGTAGVLDIALSDDNKRIAAIGRSGEGFIADLEKKKIITLQNRSYFSPGTKVIFHTFSKYLFTSSDDGIGIWNPGTGGRYFQLPAGEVGHLSFIHEGNDVLFTRGDSLYVYDFFSMKQKVVLAPRNAVIANISALKDDLLLIEYTGLESVIVNMSTLAVRRTGIATQTSDLCALSSDHRYLFEAANNKVTRRSMSSGAAESTFFSVDSTDQFVIVPGNYYKCSPQASRLLHYVTKDRDIVSFDQLDIKYNRPDKVLRSTGNTDITLINAFTKAFQKRVKKLGVDTAQFRSGYSVPQAKIVNREDIAPKQTMKELTLHISAMDSLFDLVKFNAWVNDVPLFGAAGIAIGKRKHFDTTISLVLSQGNNRIEASVININGTESFRSPLLVKYTPPGKLKERTHFIGIGINHFKEPGHTLRWSVNDINKLAVKLKEKYPDIIIDTLFDASVTKANILALKQKLQQLDVDDRVILSYSGHGVLSKDLDYFLSTYNISFNDPVKNGLAYDELESMMDGIKPRKKLMLIDACHSGEVDKEEIERIEAATKALDSLGTKSDTVNRSSIIIRKNKLGMANSFDLMQSLFVNVSRGTGATVISAAGGMQYAQERGDLQSGVFTYSIIDAFNKNKSLTVSQLKKIVGEAVPRLTNGLQKPTSRNETGNFDWTIW